MSYFEKVEKEAGATLADYKWRMDLAQEEAVRANDIARKLCNEELRILDVTKHREFGVAVKEYTKEYVKFLEIKEVLDQQFGDYIVLMETQYLQRVAALQAKYGLC